MPSGDHTVNVKIRWAQRKDTVLVTYEVLDSKNVKVTFTEDAVSFTCTSPLGYSLSKDLEVFDKINAAESKYVRTDREVVAKLKKEKEEEWDRLIKSKVKDYNIRTDFDLWRDEDDHDFDSDFGGYNFDEQMGEMGDMGGDFGGEELTDSDDEGMPDLEEVKDAPKPDEEKAE